MLNKILDTGISVAYEPDNSSPVVDIVFVHGLHGHPVKTWTCDLKNPDAFDSAALVVEKEEKRKSFRRTALRLLGKQSKAAPTCAATTLPANSVFWPTDILAKECPNSRILVFGYDSKITKYTAGEINHNSILSHSRDLLFALRRERDIGLPLVFVAHSLGGIVVKEMLARSSSYVMSASNDIVKSTAAVVFLGTPHRGSQDVAALGEVVRSIVSSFGMETTSVILDALGLKTPDLERVQEDFSQIWQLYDFQVKTFQEGLSLPKLGKKVVPDYSSLIGDYRENAETLQANHSDMCRYSGTDDPNYRKVAGELRSIYHSIAKLKATKYRPYQKTEPLESVLNAAFSKESPSSINSGYINEAYLGSLWFPTIDTRIQSLENPTGQTCSWLFSHELYQDWFHGRSRHNSYGLLWLKGKPGAGKSMLMKEGFRRAKLEQANLNYDTAAFFFNAKGDKLEHSFLGLMRSLLYQLLPGDKQYLQKFKRLWDDKQRSLRGRTGTKMIVWTELELKTFFRSMIVHEVMKRTIIFIDALDECDELQIRDMAYFWREITISAYNEGVDLDVCLSSRHFPTVTLMYCPDIIVEQHNSGDIATYVDHRLKLCIGTQEPQWELLKEEILRKSAGVFLWVVLVVKDVLQKSDDGSGMTYLMKRVLDVPVELQSLFFNMFSNLEPDAKPLAVRLFQWAILSTKPLRIHEWHHIMAFIRQPALKSLSEWRQSVNFTDSNDQLEKQIRSASRGLIEVKKVRVSDSQIDGEVASIHAGAGSLDLEHGDTRIIQVIHESVREFFLTSNGFGMLDSSLVSNPIGNGHLSIMTTCLDYLDITELDALVNARIRVARQETSQGTQSARLIAPSSRGAHAGYRDVMPDFERRPPNRKQSTTKEGNASFYEKLSLLDDTPGINIVEWLAKDDVTPAGWTFPDRFVCESVTHASNVSQSQMLEDYPALLSYATVKIFTHYKLAEEDGVDTGTFIKRLEGGATWIRWVALREDIPIGTSLNSYLARMRLESGDEPIHDDIDCQPRNGEDDISDSDDEDGSDLSLPSGLKSSDDVQISSRPPHHPDPFDVSERSPHPLSAYSLHRPRSVASFCSAGSHD